MTKKASAEKNKIKIAQYDPNWNFIGIWNCRDDIYRVFGTVRATKFKRCLDKNELCGGYYWRRYEDNFISGENWSSYNYNNSIIYVSDLGRIMTLDGGPTYGSMNDSGYMTYKRLDKKFLVHRLVLLAFRYRNDHESMICDHINFNKSDNRLVNLRWVTIAQNNQHTHKMGNINFNPHKRRVLQTDLDNNIIKIFNSIIEASELCGVSTNTISKYCNNENLDPSEIHGFKWSFI